MLPTRFGRATIGMACLEVLKNQECFQIARRRLWAALQFWRSKELFRVRAWASGEDGVVTMGDAPGPPLFRYIVEPHIIIRIPMLFHRVPA